MKNILLCSLSAAATLSIAPAVASVDFDFGADLRVREELFENIPGTTGGGQPKTAATRFNNVFRFRPRVWGELKLDTEDAGAWRLYARLADEFRWNVEPYKNSNSWPGEAILDNLFIEGKGLFDGLLDVSFGRQDIWNHGGFVRVFVDGTPGDGSRTIYGDLASLVFHTDEDSTLELFGLYNFDSDRDFRFGYDYQRYSSLTARYPDGSGHQDDWGYGAIWSSKFAGGLGYRLIAAQKNSLHPGDARRHTEVFGGQISPRWSDELTSEFEILGEMHNEWSAYADICWKSAREGIRPYISASYRFMSRDWDPMWARAVNDSESFLYGPLQGVAWWSNMHLFKLTAGLDFGRHHFVALTTGPMFSAENDGVGGGDGHFKGYLSQLRYNFPLLLADREKGERFEIVGHAIIELFNPGDYYESDKPAWFFRWQLEFKF